MYAVYKFQKLVHYEHVLFTLLVVSNPAIHNVDCLSCHRSAVSVFGYRKWHIHNFCVGASQKKNLNPVAYKSKE